MSEPKYLIVKNNIKEKILSGTYTVGSKIPSETELTHFFVVSRHTIRQAITELVNEGYLLKKQGSGTYVSNKFLDRQIKSTRTIGLITTYVSDYIFPSIIRGIEEELSKNNYSLMLSSTQNNVLNEKASLEKMLQQGVEGLIVEPTRSNLFNPNLNYYLQIMQRNIPLLMLHAKYDELHTPVISMDDEKSGRIATEHLIKLGHKKIAMITKTDDIQGKKRLKGFIDALNTEGLTFESNHILTYDTDSEGDLPKQFNEVLNSSSIPTAFVCYNDQVAISLIQEVRLAGKSVPEDFSVVSHDDSFLSTALPSINLTSVIHPKEEMGKKAAEWMMNAIEQRPFTEESIVFQPELKIGNSTRKLSLNTSENTINTGSEG